MTSTPIPAQPLQAPEAAPRPWVILVVDDEPDMVQSFKELLQQSLPGAVVLTARSGAEGLTKLEGVDLVVADYRMPGMDGIGFLAYCQTFRPTTRRILMTAFTGAVPELENRARREANVAAFVSKGLGPQAFVDAVRSVLPLAREPPS